MIFKLDPERLDFPNPFLGESEGLLAVGGDLSVDRLLRAYSLGIFPWYAYRKRDNSFRSPDGKPWIQWWCPLERFVIFPSEIHISHSMRQMMRSSRYECTFNMAFDDVIANCSRLRIKEKGAWLGRHIIKAFTKLHDLGHVKSVEVWEKDADGCRRLVGGLYGVKVNDSFIGESMFSLIPSASKLALIFLAQRMAESGGRMIDCQLHTPHLESMGGRYIHYTEYIEILKGNNNDSTQI